MPSRSGPRKPGQSASVFAPADRRASAARRRLAPLASPESPRRGAGAVGWLGRRSMRRAVSRAAVLPEPRRERRRLVAGLGQEPFLGSLRPPPVEIRIGVAGDAAGPHERQHSAREQDGGDHRRAPRSAREATAGHRPGDQGEAQDRDGEDGKHHPHHPVRNGLVNDARCRDQRDDHQDDGAQALGPGRPAEEQPPDDDRQPADELRQSPPMHGLLGNDDGDDQTRPATAAPRRPRRATAGAAFRVGSSVCAMAIPDHTLLNRPFVPLVSIAGLSISDKKRVNSRPGIDSSSPFRDENNTNRVIVDHAHRLHEGITDRRTDELEASAQEIAAQGVRLRRARGHLLERTSSDSREASPPTKPQT